MDKLFDIVHENAGLLVINKPAGLVCHPTKNGEMSSLIGRVRLYLGQNASPHLVNRLDRETSGLVLVAKNAATAGELGKALENRAMQKEYLAITHGHLRETQGVIDAPLGKDEQSPVAVKDRVRPDGAPAQTHFSVLRAFVREGKSSSLLRVLPQTGRKHQIRIHLAHIGHPIVGDKLYGADPDCYLALVQNRLTAQQRATLIFENHALHARSLSFPLQGETRFFSCEPESWFADFAVVEGS